jgi:Uma2 family endonuclease
LDGFDQQAGLENERIRLMARHIEDEVEYYYDSHSTEEDLMGETSFHDDLIRYLIDVLTRLFSGQPCAIYHNLNFYQTSDDLEYPLAPDIAVIKGVNRYGVRSWRIGKNGPPPQIVFEIASSETSNKDLDEKPLKYARMGVQEYYAYDPNEPSLPRSVSRRLFGWQFDANRRTMKVMPVGARGEIWSPGLDSWLVSNGNYLRLCERDGRVRLTRAESLAEKLRSLGIDPDEV